MPRNQDDDRPVLHLDGVRYVAMTLSELDAWRARPDEWPRVISYLGRWWIAVGQK